jgi:diguanylate cyclase (GGDEF)-like protein
VAAAEGARAREVDGLVYDDNDGLVAQVVRVGAPLPPKAPALLERVKVFDLKLRAIGSLRVMPLMAGGKVIGTLVASSAHRNVLEGEARRRIDALSVLTAGALDRAIALDQVSQLATTDGLTGIANRRQLDHTGDRIVKEAARYQRPVAAIMTDVDYFKRVNDGYGHVAGDDVLKGLASILREEARASDLVGRYGGEEFMVLLPNTDAEGARLFAERLRARLEAAEFATQGGLLRVTASFGVSTVNPGSGTLADLIANADAALYRAKESGRNRVEVALTEERRKTA